MKKMSFKIKPKEDFSLFPLIKEVNMLSCRISINLEDGIIEVEDVENPESVIDSVIKQFDILSVNIDNTTSATAKTEETTIKESFKGKEKEEKVAETQPENDLFVKKVEFENELIEETLNKLAKTAYWAIYKANVAEKEVERYILSCQSEMSMEFSNNKEIIDFEVGDIIDCNFGMHLMGEAQGAHIIAIVCDIANNMACVCPIAKNVRSKRSPHSYIPFKYSKDADFFFEGFSDSYVILDRTKYVRVERFRKVVGHVKPNFFEKLLKNLANVFNFTKQISDEKPKEKIAEKISTEEVALLEVVGPALEHLRPDITPTIQAASFAKAIGLETANEIVIEAFVQACKIKKINFENVITAISTTHNGMDKNTIKMQFKEVFKNWLTKYPEIAIRCPRISFTSLLKVFAKKFNIKN